VALLTLVVNTAIIGNYSDVNVGVKVPGILAPGTYNGDGRQSAAVLQRRTGEHE
jgi:hypothetical protein